MNSKDTTMEQVEAMSHMELCYHWRFDKTGKWIAGDPITERAIERYRAFGGMTPEISKAIGWDEKPVVSDHGKTLERTIRK